MRKTINKNGLTLALFALVSTTLVTMTYYGTQQKRNQQVQAQLQRTLDQVIEAKHYNNDLLASCVVIQDAALGSSEPLHAYIAKQDENIVAIALESVAPNGYNGKIKLITGIDHHGHITGSRVLSHQETPGLGDKIDIRISNWMLEFNGENLTERNQQQWQVRKDGGKFDQFTGATITPRAVVQAVKNTLSYYQSHQQNIINSNQYCEK